MERKIETFFRKWQKDIIRKPLIMEKIIFQEKNIKM